MIVFVRQSMMSKYRWVFIGLSIGVDALVLYAYDIYEVEYKLSDYYVKNVDAFLAGNLPTTEDVANRLLNKTFLINHDGKAYARYYDSDHRFFEWHGSQVYKGDWSAQWRLIHIHIDGRSKWGQGARFCVEYLGFDHYCRVLLSIQGMLSPFESIEETNGDPLKLSTRTSVPSLDNSGLDMSGLEKLLSSQNQK